jgi:hypothetical protein
MPENSAKGVKFPGGFSLSRVFLRNSRNFRGLDVSKSSRRPASEICGFVFYRPEILGLGESPETSHPTVISPQLAASLNLLTISLPRADLDRMSLDGLGREGEGVYESGRFSRVASKDFVAFAREVLAPPTDEWGYASQGALVAGVRSQ